MKQAPTRQLAILGAVVAGGFMAVQARVNSGLAAEVESGFLAALISFSIGLALIAVISLPRKDFRAALKKSLGAIHSGTLKVWMLFAGALGGFFVLTQGLVAGVTGIALFSLGVVTGQTISALLIDGKGLLGLTKRKLTGNRLSGSAVAIAGLVLASSPTVAGFDIAILVPVVAGVGIGLQDAINSQVGRESGSASVATFFNFLAGTLFLLLVFLFSPVQAGTVDLASINPVFFLGGLVGVGFILIRVVVLPVIGSLATGLSLLAGQLLVSLVLDFLAPVAAREITVWTLAGLLLVFAGASFAMLRR
ncbi:MAG: DMT family transporter [Aquiluna sp.]